MTIQEAVPPARHPRLDALDAFRGLAAFWVVLHHVILRYPYFLLGQPMPETPVFLGFSLADAGTVPVLWFFLISGFVITWTIDRTRTPMDFVVSRFSRLYPAYWASIAVTVGLAALAPLPGIGFTPRQVLVNLTMLQDFVGVVSVDGAFWSLAVELVFYVLALSVFRLGLWRFVHVLALAWAMLGLMAAVLGRWDIHAPWPVTAALCFVAIGLIAWAAHGGMRWLAAAPLLWLGAISYSLYLSHEMVSFTVIHALDAAGLPHAASIIASIVVALLLASAISYGIERPALRRIRAAWRARGIRQALAAAATGGPAARPATPGSPG
jgi:peptidoglycan/LPS O-acetylase OafA/YrhL